MAAFACTAAGSASAEDRGRSHPSSFFDNDIGFEVAGRISARCTVAQDSQTGSFGEVVDGRVGGNREARLDLAVRLDCNSPFRVVMTSQNGGLVTGSRGGPAFRNRLDYSALLALGDGRQSDPCESRDMALGGDADNRCIFRFRERNGSAGPATVRLTMRADPSPLLGGSYSDRLVVRVTPLMGGD